MIHKFFLLKISPEVKIGEINFYLLGAFLVYGLTGTVFGPGLFPGPGYAGVEGFDLGCGFTGIVFDIIFSNNHTFICIKFVKH